jgi:hypothetical protein
MGLTNVTRMPPAPAWQALPPMDRGEPARRRQPRKRRRGINKRVSSATSVLRVAGLFRYCPRIDCLTGPFGPSDCKRISTSGRGSRPPVWTRRPESRRRVALQRAWSALTARVAILKDAFGQRVSSTVSDGLSLWKALRQSFDSVSKMLCFLSEHHRISLLGNYRCLRPPG